MAGRRENNQKNRDYENKTKKILCASNCITQGERVQQSEIDTENLEDWFVSERNIAKTSGESESRRKRNSSTASNTQWQIHVQNNNMQFKEPLFQYNSMRNIIVSKQKTLLLKLEYMRTVIHSCSSASERGGIYSSPYE